MVEAGAGMARGAAGRFNLSKNGLCTVAYIRLTMGICQGGLGRDGDGLPSGRAKLLQAA